MLVPVIERVLVVGGPGSGKTRVAQRLAEKLGVPHHELDRVAFTAPMGDPDAPFWKWTRTPWVERQAWAVETAKLNGWVCDGIYAGWTTPLVNAADLVLWLDVRAVRCVTRVVRRAVAHRMRGGRDWDLRSVRVVSRGAREWRQRPTATDDELIDSDGLNGHRTVAALLAGFDEKVVKVHRPADVRRVVASL
jgi:adenylate kinase family enzyme